MLKYKILLMLSACLVAFSSLSQAGFNENFLDSNFIANPIWQGQTTKFIVNSSKQLQLNDTTAQSPAFLTTSSQAINQASWEFYVRLDFNPSASNFGRVYLVSDQSDLSQSLQGYFVQIGGQSGSVDDVKLIKQDGSIETELIDGFDGTVGLSPKLKVKVTKDSNHLWELWVDTSSAFSGFVSQGTAIDSSIERSNYFGLYCRYTSTRSDKFFFDDFVVNGIAFQDTVPPKINNITVEDEHNLKLEFNEPLEAASALSLLNYRVNQGIGNPDSVSFLFNDSTKLHLRFQSPFPNGQTLWLRVQNLADRSSNIISTDSVSFRFFIPDTAAFREIVINELYPDFNPSNGLPEGEFIELFNPSSKTFDLADYSISDPSGTAALSSEILAPGEYIIICETSLIADFAPFGRVMGVSGFPTLNNGGDLLQLTGPNNSLVDEINYNLDWYADADKSDGGWTLEQKNPFTPCNGINNFSASNSSIGGSPGSINSIYDTLPDTIAPTIIIARVLAEDQLLLSFDEAPDSASIRLASYRFSNGSEVNQISQAANEANSVILGLNPPLDSATLIELQISGISDCSGNLLDSLSIIELVIPGIPQFREVVINEFFPDFSPQIGLPEAEFIELFNASDKIFDLSDWQVGDPTTQSKLTGTLLKPGEFLIVCPIENEAAFRPFGNTQGQNSFPSLNNSGDEIRLIDNQGNLIDLLAYDDSWYGDEAKEQGGYSLEQINPFLDCSGKFNFLAAEHPNGGSPGKENSIFNDASEGPSPQIQQLFVLNQDSIEIRFNRNMDSSSFASALFIFSDGNSIDTLINKTLFSDRILAVLTNSLDTGKLIQLSIDGMLDCEGNELQAEEVQVVLPEQAKPSDLVINEVLFNPRTGGSDFVEIFNRSEKIISLEGWGLANFKDDQFSDFRQISELPLLIYPSQYFGFSKDVDNIVSEYPFTRADRLIEMPSLPAYNNDEGVVILANHRQQVIDRFDYREEMHFELLREVKGVSLERIDPDRSSDDEQNFHSAAQKDNFATPGYENSQLFRSTAFSGEIKIEPEVFSPDNDGHQDILNVNYQFNAPGFVGKVEIYDRNGRLIRKLATNELLGKKGSFSWNGINDDGEKARLGIYLILIEAFHPNGEKETFKETAVLGGRLD